jgi:hypothetical protein
MPESLTVTRASLLPVSFIISVVTFIVPLGVNFIALTIRLEIT